MEEESDKNNVIGLSSCHHEGYELYSCVYSVYISIEMSDITLTAMFFSLNMI